MGTKGPAAGASERGNTTEGERTAEGLTDEKGEKNETAAVFMGSSPRVRGAGGCGKLGASPTELRWGRHTKDQEGKKDGWEKHKTKLRQTEKHQGRGKTLKEIFPPPLKQTTNIEENKQKEERKRRKNKGGTLFTILAYNNEGTEKEKTYLKEKKKQIRGCWNPPNTKARRHDHRNRNRRTRYHQAPKKTRQKA